MYAGSAAALLKIVTLSATTFSRVNVVAQRGKLVTMALNARMA